MVNLGGAMLCDEASASFPDTAAGASGAGDGTNEDKNAEDAKSQNRAPYTMPGVLHYIQHEWSRFEMERAQWEMERAELQARISFLQGERKGQENLKQDLVRRIKMLEYSLKLERAKNYRLTHNGQEPETEATEGELNEGQGPDGQVPMDVDAVSTQPHSNASWRRGRSLLRQYLQEIGYSETILDVRSFRVKNLLGLNSDWAATDITDSDPRAVAGRALQESEKSILETVEFLKGKDKLPPTDLSDSSDEDDDVSQDQDAKRGGKRKEPGNLDEATQEALGEFDFLNKDEGSKKPKNRDENQWGVDQQEINRMKGKYRSEQERKRHDHGSKSLSAIMRDLEGDAPGKNLSEIESSDVGGNVNVNPYFGTGPVDIDAALGLTGDVDNVDIADDFALEEKEGALPKKWNLKYTLRSHWDAVRAMQFHPVEPVLVTAGEDGTAKLWNLLAKQDAKGQIQDIEPVYTFRGHRGPILTMDMSPTGDMCFTGGYDSTVRCWSLPSTNTDIYDKYDGKVLQETLKGHGDAVWSVAFHTSDNRLVSASADGTMKLWEPGNGEPLLKTYGPPSVDLVPTSVDFVSTEPQQLLAAYTPGHASILDLESGRSVLSFDFAEEGGSVGRITEILSHPTMPVTVTAGEDRKIRYFDNNTGKLIQGTVAHVEAISSLAIDPNGLYLLSGSHDGSLRLWNMEKRVCLQEVAAHRKKFDMSVLSVAFHPSRPLIGSAGADGLAKVYA